MKTWIAWALGAGCAVASVAEAQEHRTLGTARLFTNDFFGDGGDRWRSGSYRFSVIRGDSWSGERPERVGGLLEYRFESQVITPQRGLGDVDDRPFVGMLSFGVHSHVGFGAADVSLGADLVAIGPQTGVSDFQDSFHDLFSLPSLPGVERELEDAVHLAGTAELSYPVRMSERMSVRPFVEAQAGAEDIVRFGADVILGQVGQRDLMVRDGVSGQLIRGVEHDGNLAGLSFVAGADLSQVFSSIYLPEDQGFVLEDVRWRARAGVHWQIADEMSVFYGTTYLSREFEGQSEGQVVGGVKLNFNF